jgi:hypothetical protein
LFRFGGLERMARELQFPGGRRALKAWLDAAPAGWATGSFSHSAFFPTSKYPFGFFAIELDPIAEQAKFLACGITGDIFRKQLGVHDATVVFRFELPAFLVPMTDYDIIEHDFLGPRGMIRKRIYAVAVPGLVVRVTGIAYNPLR